MSLIRSSIAHASRRLFAAQHSKSLDTLTIHAGQYPDPTTGAVCTPISLASTFVQIAPGVNTGFMYSRFNNPTRKAFEDCVAKLEGGEYGLAFSSGMGATASIINMLNAGDHVITIDDVYGGTNEYFRSIATKAGDLSFSFVDLPKEGEFEKHITPKTKLLWMETPTNPTLKISDIQKLCKIAHKHGIVVVVDNTFASPYLQSPLELGADIVMHSVTKYINGHSDVVMGVLAMKDQKLFEKLKSIQGMVGAVPSPFDCYMALRGLKTLHVRMERHQKNATVVANFLDGHPKVEKVIYPGLKSHPGHEIAKKQMRGFGGMVSFFLKGGLEESRIFLENLKVFTLAVSLGSVESLAEHPAIMTHNAVPVEQRKELGISDTFVRLSIGLEDVDDLVDDLKSALDAIPEQK